MTNQQIEKSAAQQQLKIARGNLLLMIGFTILNLILLATGADVMMLFSATVPYLAVAVGIVSEFPVILAMSIGVAILLLLAYFFCWLFSKKHYGWMIAALVLFSIDTLCMAGLYIMAQDFSGILDVIFHAWVLYYLIIGIKYGQLLSVLPEEADGTVSATVIGQPVPAEPEPPQFAYSTPLRQADETVKYRILLETESFGHHICYRRVKRVNELVIDGYVYDDVEMLVESAHALNAKIDGHTFQAGYDGLAHSYLRVDGNTVAKKLRLR